MRRMILLLMTGIFVATPIGTLTGQQQPTIDVFKSAACGCCNKWVEHLQAYGFTVRATNREDLAELKAKYRVPRGVQSCHTALVNGYAVEGHVPAADIQRLLKERPSIVGLAVAGMPIGSPGMEVKGRQPQPFDVVAFDKEGRTRVFGSHAK